MIQYMHDNNIIKILNFPILKQSSLYSDGLTVAQSILAYYNDKYNEDELFFHVKNIDAISTSDKFSISLDRIKEFFLESGYKLDEKHMNVNDVINFINNDIPVVLLIQSWGDVDDYTDEWKNGHYVVAIGYTTNKMLFLDPMLFNIGCLTFEELNKRWHFKENDIKYINHGIAVSGKRPRFDKNKLIKID